MPACRIGDMPEELSAMISAVLCDLFEITSDNYAEVLVEADSGSVNFTYADAKLSLPRPVGISALCDAAASIAASANAYNYSADEETRSAVLGDISVTLTDTEFRLYSAILENRYGFTSKEELSMAVWGRYDPNLCAVYISYLRRKLDSAFGDGTLITARGKGYRLRGTNTQK